MQPVGECHWTDVQHRACREFTHEVVIVVSYYHQFCNSIKTNHMHSQRIQQKKLTKMNKHRRLWNHRKITSTAQ